MSNLITASTLRGGRDPTEVMMKALVITGGRQQLRPWLRTRNYDGDLPTCVPVLSLDPDTPRVNGARWHLQGKLPREVGVNAKDLFTTATTEKIFFKVEDLAIFSFTAGNEGGENVSAWIDAEALSVRYMNGGEGMDRGEVEEKGLNNFCVRVGLQLEGVSSALLWLAAAPLSKEELIRRRADYSKRSCPQIHLGVGPRESPSQRSLSIRLAVAEGVSDGCGFGVFPGLENLAASTPILPSAADVKEALFLFLRRAGGFNPKSAATFSAALDVPVASTSTKEPLFLWPELPREAETTNPEEGRIMRLSFVCMFVKTTAWWVLVRNSW